MNHTKPQVIIDLEEYQRLNKQIEILSTSGDGDTMTPLELQETTGRLLYVALNNPGVFRSKQDIDLGKFKAVIVSGPGPTSMGQHDSAPRMLVKFIRI